jgi:predicted PurR-regulated permease PerM
MNNVTKNIIFLIIILAILVLSQQPYFEKWGREIYRKIDNWVTTIWQYCQGYWNKNILHRVSSEIEKRQNIAKQELKDETKQVTQNIWEKIRDYVAGIFNNIFNRASQENK